NKKVLYDLLFRTSAETLLEVARDPKHLGAEIGFFSVLHTLESETHGPPTCSLRGASRWIVCRSHALDQTTLRFLSSRRGAQSRLSRQVPRSAQARLSRRQGQLSWRSKTSRSTENICCVALTTVPKRLGGLLETSIRRP